MRELLECNPIIGAIKDDHDLEKVIDSDCNVVFLLNGDILTLKDKVLPIGPLKDISLKIKYLFVIMSITSGINFC